MGKAPQPRVGDRERTRAAAALDAHLAAGRLTPDEHEVRGRRALEALTHAELTALFHGLPKPHPRRKPDRNELTATLLRASVLVFLIGVPSAILLTVLFDLWYLIPVVMGVCGTLLIAVGVLRPR